MADYYQLITKAVAGLDPDASGESRWALYERARAALLCEPGPSPRAKGLRLPR